MRAAVLALALLGCDEPEPPDLPDVPATMGEACARLAVAFCDGQAATCGDRMDVTLRGLCYAHHHGSCCEDAGICASPYGLEVDELQLVGCVEDLALCPCAMDDRPGAEACIAAVVCSP